MWKTIRENAGKSQEEIAKIFNVSKQAISCFEKGKRTMPLKIQRYYLILRGNESDLELAKLISQKEMIDDEIKRFKNEKNKKSF